MNTLVGIGQAASAVTISNSVDAAQSRRSDLSELIGSLNRAGAATDRWVPIEEELGLADRPPAIKVYGGKTPALKIVEKGKPDVDVPARDWYFYNREDIEKEKVRALANAKSDDDRDAVINRYTELLDEFDRQEKAARRAVPKPLRAAKRKLEEAHNAWLRAEQDIIHYRPTDLSDAAALLEFAGKDGTRGVYFHVDDADLKTIMRNAAAAIRQATASS